MRQLLLIGFLWVTTGCATMMNQDHNRTIFITSTPAGAVVTVNGRGYERTPTVVHYRGEYDLTVVLERAGCPDYQTLITTSLNPWVFGNIFVGGLIGLMIDQHTGAAYQYEPRSLHIEYNDSQVGPCTIVKSNGHDLALSPVMKPIVDARTGY